MPTSRTGHRTLGVLLTLGLALGLVSSLTPLGTGTAAEALAAESAVPTAAMGPQPLSSSAPAATGLTGVGAGATLLGGVQPMNNPALTFNPGNIISDQLFYDGNAMTAAQVQTFLNGKVPRCTIGDPGRKAGSAWGNTTIAATCLRNYTANTKSRAATEFCGTYTGANKETAAQIIAKASKACGISQKVMLVLLEKEQSLVTDTWPTVTQFRSATGFGCPDTAACSSASYGLVEQVYNAASQFKRYQKYPRQYRHQPQATNAVYWHPSDIQGGPKCGTSQVYIANSATAGLYNYTPYRPNQAALNAGWGTGDQCSSYGNRNFHNFYTSWFGPTSGYAVLDGAATLWASLGGMNGSFGAPKQNRQSVTANGGGYVQEFAGGVIFTEHRTKKVTAMSNGAFLTNYRNAGFVSGAWGWPTAMATCGLAGGGCTMSFQTGLVAYSGQTGSHLIPSGLVAKWNQLGGASGSAGYPTGKHTTGKAAGVLRQKFQKETLVASTATGAQVLDKRFIAAFDSYGGINGAMGLPKGAPKAATQNGGGVILELAKGTLYQSSRGTFGMEFGAFRTGYLNAGGPQGFWGWPAAKASCGLIGGGCQMGFQHGIGMWSPKTPMTLVSRDSFAMWNTVKGSIGYPTKNPSKVSQNGGGEVQEFTKGTVWTSSRGSFAMEFGAFRTGYLNAGGPQGAWGWPAAKAQCQSSSSCTMDFQHGTAKWTAKGGMTFTKKAAPKMQSPQVEPHETEQPETEQPEPSPLPSETPTETPGAETPDPDGPGPETGEPGAPAETPEPETSESPDTEVSAPPLPSPST